MANFPDVTNVSRIRLMAETARSKDGAQLIIDDEELIQTLLVMCDEIMRIAAPEIDPFRLDQLSGLGAGSMRALRARGISNLKALARAKPDDIRAFLLAEGVMPKRTVDDWPQQAQQLVAEITKAMKNHE
jgi:DNA polymerase/3'-5' exonuclease PolX